MNHPRNAGAVRLGLCVAMTVVLAACSHSAPSESDAKAVIKQRLADCKYFTIDSFDKTNGTPIDENDYNVDVKYTVSLKPGSDMSDRLKEDAKLFQQYQLIKADYSARKDELTKTFNTTMAAHNGDPSFNDAAANDQYRQSLQTDPQLVKDMNDVKDIAAKIGPVSGSGLFQKAIVQECPNLHVSNGFMLTFFGPKITLDQMADGMSAEFTETIPMMRTDNGWQATR
ncbi:hypothetical protein FSO04_06335 [Paraburkholderia madseniana]|uniref:Uncharacterized protein n=1 Tax=Paraburkholderia madseniana TaxID=2599607 RepID=A0A6N6WN94_9BURK|nr:hypothetical protein [Paraburkholderia madseniana]KAE8760840.1 hypothetical protein FSO04_06335 [Paraburkholderia madseniana]